MGWHDSHNPGMISNVKKHNDLQWRYRVSRKTTSRKINFKDDVNRGVDVTQTHLHMHFTPRWVNTIRLPTVPFKAPQLIHVANLRKPLAQGSFNHTTTACTVRRAEAAFQFESRYINLSANSDLGEVQWLVSCYKKIPICNPYLCRKGWRLNGQEAVLLMNEDFDSCTVWHKYYTVI
jgi:hypothetical protein